jgi:hypothetical protein
MIRTTIFLHGSYLVDAEKITLSLIYAQGSFFQCELNRKLSIKDKMIPIRGKGEEDYE